MAHVLETYMKENDISQAEMAKKVGVCQSMVSQWINKARPIAPKKARAIEEATEGVVTRHELRPDIFDPPANQGVT